MAGKGATKRTELSHFVLIASIFPVLNKFTAITTAFFRQNQRMLLPPAFEQVFEWNCSSSVLSENGGTDLDPIQCKRQHRYGSELDPYHFGSVLM